MENAERFNKNLARWSVWCPEGAAVVCDTLCDQVSVSAISNGQSNLAVSDGSGNLFFYHSPEDPEQEAKSWFASLALDDVKVVYVYGVGLGYSYYAARPWLRADENHCLVFIEDNPQVIHRLLEDEAGTSLLNDSQVSLFYFSDKLFPEGPDEKIISLSSIVMPFSLYPFTVTALPGYERIKTKRLAEIKALISFYSMIHKSSTMEYSGSGAGFFNNFFCNYLLLPQSYLADRMFGKFTGVPAIICGAGPSLDTNVGLLAKMHDRALIFAGGTAMNALNAQGILPHFGVGIDPNPDHFSRIIMNNAYETPFLYRNRILNEALTFVHGDRLCVGGSCGYEVANWFQKKLGIAENEIVEGNNVLNFSLAIAYAMGCHPILLVGIDLAYSQGRSYASGIISHPIHDRKLDFRTKKTQDELLLKNDIYGNPVPTLWKWVGESLWYSQFTKDHPDVQIINATEGGIGFIGIPNMSLKEAAEQYLTKHFDLDSRLHGEIQNSAFSEEATLSNIRAGMQELADSLKICEKRYQTLEELELQFKDPSTQFSAPPILEKIHAEEDLLAEETAYRVMLKAINDACLRFYALELHRLKCQADQMAPEEAFVKQIDLDLKRHASLKGTAHFNAFLIDMILKENEKAAIDAGQIEPIQVILPVPGQDELYLLEARNITIKDPEMGLSYAESLSPDAMRKEQIFYPGGALKCEQCYKGVVLHGPSSFYHENGTIIARSWFLEGERQGKMWTYYATGELHSLQRFRAGQRHGIQEYYYCSARPKSILPYENGKLSGLVLLYHPNGKEARKLRFVDGKRYGMEYIWSESGRLIVESQYLADKPIGIAKKWYSTGNIASEIVYDDRSNRLSEKMWKPDGSPVDMEERERSDYFSFVAKQTGKLTDSIEEIITQLSKMTPVLFETIHDTASSSSAHLVLTEASSIDFAGEFQELGRKMDELRKFGEVIQKEFSLEEGSEALLQNDAGIHLLENQLMLHKRQMDTEMSSIEKNLKHILNETIKRLEKGQEDQNNSL